MWQNDTCYGPTLFEEAWIVPSQLLGEPQITNVTSQLDVTCPRNVAENHGSLIDEKPHHRRLFVLPEKSHVKDMLIFLVSLPFPWCMYKSDERSWWMVLMNVLAAYINLYEMHPSKSSTKCDVTSMVWEDYDLRYRDLPSCENEGSERYVPVSSE